MKTKLTLTVMVILGFLVAGCNEKKSQTPVEEVKIDIVNDEFPEAKEEIKQVLDDIFKSINDDNADQLISYHVYGPKFTEFRNDGPRLDSKGNEEYERGLVGAVSTFDYNLGDLKIDVFGDVAVVTFEADFRPTIEGDINQIWANVTLVFIKVNDSWKITHEHFTQFEKPLAA